MGNNPVTSTIGSVAKKAVNNPVTNTVKKAVDNPVTNTIKQVSNNINPINDMMPANIGINIAKAVVKGDINGAVNQANPVNHVNDNINKVKAIGNVKNINRGDIGVVSIDGNNVQIKPQFKFGAGGDNFDIGGGLGDVRDGIHIGFDASIFRTLCASGNSYQEVINNLQFKANNELTDEFCKGHDQLLEFVKKSNNIAINLLDKIGINLKSQGIRFQINAKISASHSAGVGAGIKCGWTDTEGYNMVGAGGKLLDGGSLYYGLHKDNDKVKIEIGFPSVYLKMIAEIMIAEISNTGEFVIEGTKAPIKKIAQSKKDLFVVQAKYGNKQAVYKHGSELATDYDPSVECSIGFLGDHNKWICHQSDGKVVCNRDVCNAWEIFRSVPISKDVVAFKSHRNQYLSARPEGNVIGIGHCKAWEHFKVIINENGTCAFIGHHGKYLSAQPDGRLECNRTWNREWEQFNIKLVDKNNDDQKYDNDNAQSKKFDPNKKCKVSLKGFHGKYICAEGDGRAVCNRDWCREWEEFWSVPIGNGKIGLYSHHGKYVCAEGSGKVVANRGHCKEWEQFKVIECDNGKYGLLSHHNKYLSAQPNGALECNRDKLLEWEQFEITVLQ